MKKSNQYPVPTWIIATCILLTPLVSLTGCGNTSEPELDRVPNVPPSTRGTEGAAVFDPTGR